jgi:carboxypeptidase Q
MGGHLDSWDTGSQTGANDDGGGFVVCFEALRVLSQLGLRPRRTIRFIAWTGEEMGDVKNGAKRYAENALKNGIENHILAFESDEGTTDIYGFGYTGNTKGLEFIKDIAKTYLKPINASYIKDKDGISADVEPLSEVYGIPVMRNLINDTDDQEFYFTYHHTAGDSMTMMSKEDLDRNVIAIASMMYIVADSPDSLTRDHIPIDLSKLNMRKNFLRQP